ncbi:hypothetical protein GCM10017674_29330 [Streptomyces gardneri]|uniref:Uncharacterized protein n=1 Tax=Streptomyces gardneri TaxID=66892 RepID=A0A4Y3RBM5_9ACTN|nr:hypothetical protein SGA01_07410 [Streptomyces gardneri]GHG96789.1 hypothetical protein GCM10017674_29330 [Streptomyces gardneri]
MSSSTACGASRVRPQGVGLGRLGEQREGPVGDHVGRGVEPRRQQEAPDADQFLVREVGVPGQVAEQVVGGLGALGRDELGHVLLEPDEGAVPVLGRHVHGHDRVGVSLEPLSVGVRNAQQLADHQRGEGTGEGLDQVDARSAALHRVQVRRGDLRDPVGELPHPADGELAGQDAPEAGVLGGVHPGHVADRGGRQRALGPPGERVVHQLVARAETAVAHDRADRGVTGGQPADVPVGVRHAGERPLLAQLRQAGGRVEGTAGGASGGERDRGRGLRGLAGR